MSLSDRSSLVVLCDLKYLMSLRQYLTMSELVVIIRLQANVMRLVSYTMERKGLGT